ncbi:DAK2 domain-containing protein [Aeromicrobium sp. CTD01-1L150]|uniref:DAK2 domain-containing protein n=1 Tax=Aeromicrobium sp. CTD01-1L150 TaxID=3341830 RepID=UPI0035C1338C
MVLQLRPDAFRVWTQLCVESLSRTRAEIDALNVFPVPDSDTGTNSYLTIVAGAEAVAALGEDATLPELVRVYTDGLLTGAKGNSGVILSQLARATFGAIDVDQPLTAEVVASAFRAASDAAHAAVGTPVEGTILSVAAAAAQGAEAAAEAGLSGQQAFARAAGQAREALERTPQQMEMLARAGVVDAGGRALVVVLDATEQALTGRTPERGRTHVPVPEPLPAAGDDFVAGGPAYEVMYLLEADDPQIPALRDKLQGLGDSLVVVGGERLWNVHVHVDDVGAAIEAGMAAGRPYRIAVTHFADQIASQTASARDRGRAVVVATTGSGVSALCREAGADVLEFTRAAPLGFAQMTAALREAGADEVIVLPNNQRYVGLFEAAAREAREQGIRVAVIPTHAQVQGLSALAVHDPGLGFDDDVVAMSSAAAATQHGAVTIATEPGITMAGPCRAGDALGVVSGDFAVVGTDLVTVVGDVLDRLLSPSAELVTLVLGEGADPGLARELESRIRDERVDLDVVVYAGEQENYPLFIAVE